MKIDLNKNDILSVSGASFWKKAGNVVSEANTFIDQTSRRAAKEARQLYHKTSDSISKGVEEFQETRDKTRETAEITEEYKKDLDRIFQ